MTVQYLESGTQGTYGFEFWTSTAGTVTSVSTITRTGVRSIKCNTSSPATTASVQKNAILADAGRRTSFFAYWPSVTPSGNTSFFIIRDNAGAEVANLAMRGLSPISQLKFTPFGATFVNGGTVLVANTWYRISVAYTITNTTTFTFKVYINGVLEITATAGTMTRTGSNQLILLTDTGGGTNWITYFSDIYVDDGTDLADPGNIGVTYKAPASDNVGNFNTVIGSNPGATKRHTNVDERPLNTAQGWSDSSVTAQNENYTLQDAATGDVNISNYPLIARTAWVYAKQSPVLGTVQMTDNGTSTTITPTTSPALYTITSDSTSYPSNVAGIGMVSSGLAADPVSLYECGMLIAYFQVVVLGWEAVQAAVVAQKIQLVPY